VADVEIAVGHAHEHFDGEGRLTDDELRGQLREVVDVLLAEAQPRVSVAA
jgi:aromatic ring-cleaving dioxygenase